MAFSTATQDQYPRSRLIGLALVVLLVAVGAGAAAYLVTKNSGEDLNEARRLGATVGTVRGHETGTEKGFQAGFKAGRAAGFALAYKPSYRAAYRGQFEEAGLEVPAPKEIRVALP